jgi:Tol biopolymer transport system component
VSPHGGMMGLQKGALLGRYEIVALVGAGGMGEVYRARDERIGRNVAIKVLPPEFGTDPERLRRFEQEARAAGALDHPNILAVHDVGSFEGSPYMVTEFLEGETLHQRLHGTGLTVRKAVEIAIQIARGLAAAHEKGIVHRDLKPANVFIANDGQVKILDFGLAKVTHPEVKPDPYGPTATSASSTEAGAVLGTMGYMSPEQLRGNPADARSDIFAFGCVLYEMVSGQPPFLKATAADTVSAVLHEEPPGLDSPGSTVPPGLRQIVRRCLEKRPQDRFSTAHDLALALEAAASGDSELPVRGTHQRWALGRAWIVPAALLAALVAVAGLWLVQRKQSDSLPPFHTRQVTGRFGIESEPAISPSGSEIVYAAQENGKGAIRMTDIRGGTPVRLAERNTQASDPAWFPDGSTVVFTSSDGLATSIWKVPRFGGTPMMLVQNAAEGRVSPDGTRIVFTRNAEDGFPRVWVATLTAVDQARRITGPDDGLFNHAWPAWSPDGRTICYSDARDLWLVPADGGKAHPLTKDDPEDRQPVWSADGRFIYFTSTREGTLALWRIPAGGGQPVRVTDGTGSEHFPSLSRDGRRLAFVSRVRDFGLALADLRTGKISHFQEGGFACMPAIAPDCSTLVFVSMVADSVALRSLPLRDNAPAADSVVLAAQGGDIASPAFSPDGRWVAYYRAVEGHREIWVVPAQGGSPVNFSNHLGQNLQPVWSPDSSRIAFVSNRGGAYQIWVAPVADGRRTGEPRQVTFDAGTVTYPNWSPDGKSVAFVLLTDEGNEVWVAPVDGGGRSRRLTSGANAHSLRWLATSAQILVSGFWGQPLPTLRLVSPETGEARPFVPPGALTLDPQQPDFDLSFDGTLLVLFEGRAEGIIWVREADRGSF